MTPSRTAMAVLFLWMAILPASARFSKFVSVSPDNPDPRSALQPSLAFTSARQDSVAVTVPVIRGDRKYWLIVCRSPLSAEKQNFREMVQVLGGHEKSPLKMRDDVVLIAPLTENRDASPEVGGRTGGASITVQMSLELAERAYIYVDYPCDVMDGGYFWAIDIPSFVQRLKTTPSPAPRHERQNVHE